MHRWSRACSVFRPSIVIPFLASGRVGVYFFSASLPPRGHLLGLELSQHRRILECCDMFLIPPLPQGPRLSIRISSFRRSRSRPYGPSGLPPPFVRFVSVVGGVLSR